LGNFRLLGRNGICQPLLEMIKEPIQRITDNSGASPLRV
jgi:hypothetical protein